MPPPDTPPLIALNLPNVPGIRIIELILEITLQVIKDQPQPVKEKFWELALKDILFWRKALGIDPAPKPPTP